MHDSHKQDGHTQLCTPEEVIASYDGLKYL